MLLKLGFSGSIASGKTARCNRLVTHLAPSRFARVKLLSADAVGHQTYLPGTNVYHGLIKTFGSGILDTTTCLPSVTGEKERLPVINRKVLGDIVFNDPSAMKNLNAMVWPVIREHVQEEIRSFEAKVRLKEEAANILGRVSSGTNTNSAYTNNANLMIVEAALLIECELDQFFDEVWLLGCDKDAAVQRIVRRDGLTEDQARRRVDAQSSLDVRRKILEGRGFVNSAPCDNQEYLKCSNIPSRYDKAQKIMRTFDTSKHSSVEAGFAEIDTAFDAMVARWFKNSAP